MRKMHVIWLSVACVLLVTPFRAQPDSSRTKTSHKPGLEAGFNLYGLTLRPGNFYTNYKVITDQQVFSGMYLKYHMGLNALRWEVNYSQRYFRYQQGPYGAMGKNQVPARSFEIKMGFQRSFGTGRFSLYGFADLEYNYFWTPYGPFYQPGYYYENIALYAPYYEYYRISGSFFCLSPGAGLRWKIGNHIALSFETTAQLFYAREKPDNYSTNKTIESVGINAKPVRLSVGFTF